MSIYNSTAVLNNTTTSSLTIGSLTISANSSLVFWQTSPTGITQTVFDAFTQLMNNQTQVIAFVQDGYLKCVQDGISITKDQFPYLFNQMTTAFSQAANIYQLLTPVRNQPVDSDGNPVFASVLKSGEEVTICTHNFADPCTWFGDSVRVNNEVLTNPSGDGVTYVSQKKNWIDMLSGRQHMDYVWVQIQQMLNPSDPHGYQIVVKVDGYTMTMRQPFATSGGDFEPRYEDGYVIFYNSQSGKNVTISYSYATSSTFYLRPFPWDSSLTVEASETQTTLDVVMNDEFSFSFWAQNASTGVYEIQFIDKYKRASQMFQEFRGAYPVLKAYGSSAADKLLPLDVFRRTSRGLKNDIQGMPMYLSCKWTLVPGIEIRVKLTNDIPLTGEHSSQTFYCTEIRSS